MEVSAMKIRLKFTKTGVLKFVGHLDLLRLFQKAFRRAKLPMSYSQGFNPHQVISIGAPLPIGVTSEGEYMDIQITTGLSKEEAILRLNETLPEGIRIIDWILLDDLAKSAMAIIQGATYVVSLNYWPLTASETEDKLKLFLEQPSILVMKTSKKKTKEVDIRSGILKMFFEDDSQKLQMMLATGSQLNIKPELVLEAFMTYLEIESSAVSYALHRKELYTYKDEQWLALDKL